MAPPATLPANFAAWDKPPATLPANFSEWDMALPSAAGPHIQMTQQPLSAPERAVNNLGKAAEVGTNFVKGITNDVYDVSTPNIATQLYRHYRGMPNTLDQIPEKAVLGFLAAGGLPEAEASEGMTATAAAARAAPVATETAAPEAVATRSMNLEGPRTLSGDSALRQILTGQDNANLLKIAKSRGINVSQESQLKPGRADSMLINKIINDFSDDELENVRSTYLENTRMGKHNFGDIGPEAWKTMSMQTYFPDVKIAGATLKRVQTNIGKNTATAGDDLTDILKKSLAAEAQ